MWTGLASCKGFEWDEGNRFKSLLKHAVSNLECEQAFFNKPLIVAEDLFHSQKETRYFALGKSNSGRVLMVVFTVRQDLIRVISARDMSRKERSIYEKNSQV